MDPKQKRQTTDPIGLRLFACGILFKKNVEHAWSLTIGLASSYYGSAKSTCSGPGDHQIGGAGVPQKIKAGWKFILFIFKCCGEYRDSIHCICPNIYILLYINKLIYVYGCGARPWIGPSQLGSLGNRATGIAWNYGIFGRNMIWLTNGGTEELQTSHIVGYVLQLHQC